MNKNKLELTWIDKDKRVKIDNRILLRDVNLSHGDENSENLMIYGDNLLTLKSLQKDYREKINCIYIDPPFNTGNAFEHYDDGQEHSIWLNLMKERFMYLKELLREDGVLVVHLDDSEMAYCKVVLDEIFGRCNYMNTITMTTNDPSGFKATGNKIFSTANYLLVYAKNKPMAKTNKVYKTKKYDTAYGKIFTKMDGDYKTWEWTSLKEYVANLKGYDNYKEALTNIGKDKFEQLIEDTAIKNADRVFRTAALGGGAKKKRQVTIDISKENRNEIFVHENEDVADFYILNGEQIIFYNKRLVNIDGELVPGELITDVWTDISWTGIANEGDVKFKNGKKPELLIKRILELFTDEGDLVLDSFGGSGTTAAVAHKMKRRWITIEQGEQCYSHCHYRLKRVIDGIDESGISKVVKWNRGGGFQFYKLAPELFVKDKFGRWIINKDYTTEMIEESIAKYHGFEYNKTVDEYWKQGKSSEHDYIYTTLDFMTVEWLDFIYNEMGDNDSLLICCKSYQSECRNRYNNIDIKKISDIINDIL